MPKLVTREWIVGWHFENVDAALNAAHHMQLVDGIPEDQLYDALLDAGFEVVCDEPDDLWSADL